MQNRIGALWRGKMKDGSTYFHGEIEVVAGIKTKIVLFPFKRKEGPSTPKDPAYNILLSQDKKQEDVKVVKERVED